MQTIFASRGNKKNSSNYELTERHTVRVGLITSKSVTFKDTSQFQLNFCNLHTQIRKYTAAPSHLTQLSTTDLTFHEKKSAESLSV